MKWTRWVLLLAAVLFLWNLGGHDLWAPDEPYFAEGAREMIVDGEWAVPHVNGRVTTDKPPLFFWLIALFSLPLGEVTSWTARLPSALAGLGTVLLTMRVGRRFFGPRTAALGGAVLATTYLFWEKSRWSQTDALLCFLIWVALSAFEAHRAGDANGTRAGLLFWLAAALAVLDKGPVGMLLPLGIALVVLATDRSLSTWRTFSPWQGPLLFLTILGAWMVFATVGSGGEYSVWGALKEHAIDRSIHGMHHRQPFWYYAEVLPPMLLPWTALVPGAVLLAWRRRSPADRFLLVTALFVVGFFSISTEKRELYVLPAMPAFALLAAALVASVCAWDEAPRRPREHRALGRRWVTLAQGLLGGLLALVGTAVPFVADRHEEVGTGLAWILAGLLLWTGALTMLGALRGDPLRAALLPAAGIAAAYLFSVTFVYPGFESRKSARPLAERLVELTSEPSSWSEPVVAYHLGNLPEPIAFYSDGLYTLETNDAVELARQLDVPDRKWAVVHGEEVGQLPIELLRRLYVVERTRLARRPVLVLTNRKHPEGTPLDLENGSEVGGD